MEKELIEMIRDFSVAVSKNNTCKNGCVKNLEKLKSVKNEELNECVTGRDLPSLKPIVDELLKLIHLAIIPEFSTREHFDFDKDDFRGRSKKTEFVLVFFLTLLGKGKGENMKVIFTKILPDLLLLLSSNMDESLWCSTAVVDLSCKVLHELRKLYSPSVCKESLDNDNLNSLLFMSSSHYTRFSTDLSTSSVSIPSSSSNSSSDIPSSIFTPSYSTALTPPTYSINTPTSSQAPPTDPTYTPSSSIFGRYLNLVKSRLSKNKWVKNPNIQKSFEWMLKSATFPHLSDFLDQILPPCLNLLDDYNIENKCRGIRCIGHVIRNTTREELRWYGRSDVIYDALHHQLYFNEPKVVEILHPVLIEFLPVFGQPPNDLEKHHQVVSIILRDVEFENKILNRQAFTRNLPRFVRLLGVSVVMHTKKLLDVFQAYLEIYDGPEELARLNILKSLQEFILNAWPRIPCYTSRLSKLLIKFIYDVCGDQTKTPSSVKAQLLIEAKVCLLYLKQCDTDKVNNILLSIESLDMNEVVTKIIKDIRSSTSCENRFDINSSPEINELCDLLDSSKI